MLNNLTIRLRLIFLISLLSLIMAGFAGLGLYSVNQSNEGLQRVYEDSTVPAVDLGIINDHWQVIRLNAVIAANSENTAIAQARTVDTAQRDAEIGKIWDRFIQITFSPRETQLVEAYMQNQQAYVESRRRTMTMASTGDFEGARENAVNDAAQKFSALHKSLAELSGLQAEAAAQEYAAAQDNFNTVSLVMSIALVLSVLLAIALGTILIKTIIRPLNEAITVANAVASGDLTSRIESNSTNETGKLLHALKLMNDNLVDLVGKVRISTDSITTASGEIAHGNSDLSHRTEEQASSLEETASSMEELTSTVKQNADNARQANQLASGASEVAVKGGAVVGQVVETMSSINESSKKIVDIISVIDGIAFQTNILALNAAVEAARAGEQGRGFAVVATEVRTLAQRSAAAAKEIKELISDSVNKVEDGARLVDEAGVTMEEIVNSVKRVTDIMSEISAASQEQSSGIEQVNQAIMQMDDVTQQNAALVEEASAAAESMQDQAQALTQAVTVFKLAGGRASLSAKKIDHAQVVNKLPSPDPVKKADKSTDAGTGAELESTATKPCKVATGGGEDTWKEF